jgi:hypothetical protein
MDCTIVKDLSSRFYRKAKEVAWEKASTVRKELVKPELLRLRLSSYHDPQKSFSKRKKQLTPTKNWLEIIQNGVECKAMKATGLLEIEKKPYYSYLLAMSPRIATNRGCIRLEGNGRRNIDFVQVVQKN